MNQDLTIDFLEKVVGACVFSMPRLLVRDSFRCHISPSHKDHLKKLNVHAVVIPGGCTKNIQPLDGCRHRLCIVHFHPSSQL